MPRTPGLSVAAIQERWERIADLSRRGVSATEIAHQVGVNVSMVHRVRRMYGLTRTSNQRPFTAEERARMQELLDDGCSIAEAARTIGRSPAYAWKLFKGQGWTRAECGEYTRLLREYGSVA